MTSWQDATHITGPCEGNPQVTGGFPSQRDGNLEVAFMFPFIGLNMLLNEQPSYRWCETSRRTCDVIVMHWCVSNRVSRPGGHIKTSILVPYLQVKSRQLIWKPGTRRRNLRVPDLQMNTSDLTRMGGYQQITSIDDQQTKCPSAYAERMRTLCQLFYH